MIHNQNSTDAARVVVRLDNGSLVEFDALLQWRNKDLQWRDKEKPFDPATEAPVDGVVMLPVTTEVEFFGVSAGSIKISTAPPVAELTKEAQQSPIQVSPDTYTDHAAYVTAMQACVEKKSRQILQLESELAEAKKRIGVCEGCNTEFNHDGDEPFASCECPGAGTMEWAFRDYRKEPLVVQVAYLQAGFEQANADREALNARLEAMLAVVQAVAAGTGELAESAKAALEVTTVPPVRMEQTISKADIRPGLHLFTRDGRQRGNALVFSVEQDANGMITYLNIVTDFGNSCRLSMPEIRSCFYARHKDGELQYTDVDEWDNKQFRLRMARLVGGALLDDLSRGKLKRLSAIPEGKIRGKEFDQLIVDEHELPTPAPYVLGVTMLRCSVDAAAEIDGEMLATRRKYDKRQPLSHDGNPDSTDWEQAIDTAVQAYRLKRSGDNHQEALTEAVASFSVHSAREFETAIQAYSRWFNPTDWSDELDAEGSVNHRSGIRAALLSLFGQ